ncbi:MAG: hypothetical protein ACREF4_21535, partial [Gammaproteobacteria bacterium]
DLLLPPCAIDPRSRPLAATASLQPSPSLDLALTVRVLRCSTRNRVDRVDENEIWTRVVVLSRGPALRGGRQHGAKIMFDA